MASPWALEGFNGRAGVLTRLISAVRSRRRAPAPDAATNGRHRALRHAILLPGCSNQALLDTRWGEPAVADEPRR